MNRYNSYLSLIAAFFLFFFYVPEANGKLSSNSIDNLATTTGSWSTSVNSFNSAPSNNSYTITWTGSSRKQYSLISIFNTGSYAVNTSRLAFSSTKTNGDTSNPPTLTFELCSGLWNATTFSCSGSISTMTTATSGEVDIAGLIEPGNRINLRLTNLRDASFNYNTTFHAISLRSDIRSGVNLSS
jgi:hypothetical protein